MLSEIELPIYRYLVGHLNGGAEFMDLIEKTAAMNNCNFNDFTVQLQATRLSGERNTSLGNGLINLLVYMFLCKEKGLSNYDCVVEGDDLLGVFDGPVLTAGDYRELGFTVKIEYADTLNEAAFCQLIFDENFNTIADPIKIMMKMPWISARYKQASLKTKQELLKGKALSTLFDFQNCPVITEYCNMIIRNSGYHWRMDESLNNYMKTEFKKKLHEMPGGNCDKLITMESRLLMEKVFKVPVFMQLSMEKYFKSINQWVEFVNIPFIDVFMTNQQIIYYRDYVHRSHHNLSMIRPGASFGNYRMNVCIDGIHIISERLFKL